MSLTLADLQQLQDTDGYVVAVQQLADDARAEDARASYRDHLNYVLSHWDADQDLDLSTQVLRFWGNSVIDNDDNRQIATDVGIVRLSQAWRDPEAVSWDHSLSSIGVNALYNTCLDYEPAQQRAVELHLHNDLVPLLHAYDWNEGSSIFELLAILSTAAGDAGLLDQDTLERLVPVSSSRHESRLVVDLGYSLVAMTAYIKADPQRWWPSNDVGGSDSTAAALHLMANLDQTLTSADENDRETAGEQLRIVMENLVESCDAVPNLHRYWSSRYFVPWLEDGGSSGRLKECSCLILGNQALRSTKLAICYVEEHHLQSNLIFLITSSDSSASLKHAASGFLMGLALPKENKSVLVHDGGNVLRRAPMNAAIHHLLFEKDFTLIKDGFLLLNAFVKDSIGACQALLKTSTSSESQTPPMYEFTNRTAPMHGNSPFTAEPLTACARAITNMSRVMLRPGMPSIDKHAELFLGDPWLLHPLIETLRHTEDNARRLDSTVGLARIACCHPEGAAVVAKAFSAEVSMLLEAVKKVMVGEENEAKANCHLIIESVLRLARTDCTTPLVQSLESIQRQLVTRSG